MDQNTTVLGDKNIHFIFITLFYTESCKFMPFS